ncbi:MULTISPECIES: hypothetical protein [unclassified Streptomyces]|uniref:hypothetical protein n=1 Tax=unclassified Streptomyces TaxID=2593676 RepID=UPI0035DE627E
MDRNIRTVDDVLNLLDSLFTREADRWTADGASWWDSFYADRTKPVPFFVAKPDENASFYDRTGSLLGGLAYTPQSLRRIFGDLTELELRRMRDEPPESPHFGEPFLWTALFRGDGGRRGPAAGTGSGRPWRHELPRTPHGR